MANAYARTCRILNRRGLHARAAAKFVETASRFDAIVEVTKDGITAVGTSILGLMMLAAGHDTQVVLEARGAEAHAALEALAGLIRRGFDED